MIDWDAVRVSYISGRETYAEIAARVGVSKTQLALHSRTEKWPAQRKAFRENVAARALRTKANRETERLSRLMENAERLVGHLDKVTNDPKQFFRYIAGFSEIKDGEDEAAGVRAKETVASKADTKALKDCAAALNELTKAFRNLFDLPTGEQKRAHNLAVRKLSIEEKKSHAGVDPDQYGIILMPETGKPDTDGAVEVDE